MSRSRVENWSLTKSLAFLAAVLAMAFGAMVPAVVAGSASTGTPMVLCSGGQLRVVIAHGDDPAADHAEQASLTCAMALMSGLAALPTPDPGVALAAPTVRYEPLRPETVAYVLAPARAPPRPPSTAPPIA